MRRHPKHDAVVQLGREGATLTAIAKRLGMCRATVRRIFDAHGIDRGRPRRRWTELHPSPRARVRRVVE